MVLLVDCSPKIKKSNSSKFIDRISNKLNENIKICNIYYDDILYVINLIKSSQKIIFVFPLYVDAPPSRLIFLFENLKKEDFNNNSIYCIVNCGFLESDQNNIACEIVKCFCDENKIYYKGAFKIGSGEIIGNFIGNNRILEYFYLKKELKFINAIKQSNYIDIKFTIRLIPKWLFCILGNISWKLKKDNK